LAILPPSLVAAKCVTPRSMPMACLVSARGTGTMASTVKVAYQRPSGSRETITIAGSSVVTSTSGQDHTNRTEAAILASRSSPPRRVNALRV
jgi:hypothetical protein